MINRSIEVEALNRALDIALEKEYELRKTGQSHVIEPVILAIKEALRSSPTNGEAQPAVALEQELFSPPNNFYKDVDEAINKLEKNGSIFDGNDSAPYVVWLLRTLRELAIQTQPKEQEPKCNPHPKAPHGFDRNASHANDRYVCECEGWNAYDAGYEAGVIAGIEASMEQEPEQRSNEHLEPVATVVESQYEDGSHAGNLLEWLGRNEANDLPVGTKLYTTPPQHSAIARSSSATPLKPLTDAQREEIAKGWRGRNWTVGDIIDAIEAAHGIKE